MNKIGEFVISIENYQAKEQLEIAISYLVDTSNELAKSLRTIDEFGEQVCFFESEKNDIEGKLAYLNLILEPYAVNNLNHLLFSLYIRFEEIERQRQRLLDGNFANLRSDVIIKEQNETLCKSKDELNQEFLKFYQVVTRAYDMIKARKEPNRHQDKKHLEISAHKHSFLDHFRKN